MKKTFLLVVLALLATPSLVRADRDDKDHDRDHDRFNDNDRDDRHGSVKAEELAGIGIGGAAFLGVAGYLILRKRNVSA